jgi:hypothetical protein
VEKQIAVLSVRRTLFPRCESVKISSTEFATNKNLYSAIIQQDPKRLNKFYHKITKQKLYKYFSSKKYKIVGLNHVFYSLGWTKDEYSQFDYLYQHFF